ncbi:MAG TPA: 1-phosphofructokinase family hexose kinase, partial [Mesotoga infera]|nr:1-phosphofructokinase family hexose kinase [Mesotoga infera]
VIATREGVWLFRAKSHIEKSHLLGTGDAFMAGMVYSIMNDERDFFQAARKGMAAAIAEAGFISKELITPKDIEENLESFEIRRLE